MLNFCGQFSICVSFDENDYYLSDAYLEHLQYVAGEHGWNSSEFPFVPGYTVNTKSQKNMFICISRHQKRHLTILSPPHCACVFAVQTIVE